MIDFNLNYFVYGCIGAVLPEIVRLYNKRFSKAPKFSVFYYIISFLYILVGGIVANIFPLAGNSYLALCIGAGTNTSINTTLKFSNSLIANYHQMITGNDDDGNDGSESDVEYEEENKGIKIHTYHADYDDAIAKPEVKKCKKLVFPEEPKGNFWDYINLL